MRYVTVLLFASAALLHGHDEDHRASVGVRAGVPITDAFDTVRGNEAGYFTNTKRYTVGPTIEFNFPWRLSARVDALYKRLGYEYQQTVPGSVSSRTVANSWEFPATLKWEVIPGPIRPFVDTGVSVRHISGISQIRTVRNAVTDRDNAVEFNKRNDVGFVFGGGVAFKFGRVRVSPEFRYVRWGSETFRDPVRTLLRTNRNQGDFLLGVTF
jgi:opacity protein-like surface antigen